MCALMTLVVIMGTMSISDAKVRSGGSSFRSNSSRTSRPASRPSATKAKSASSKPRATASRPKAKPKMTAKSAADKKAYDSAKKSGKAFTSRDAAQKDFKAKNADKYKSTYDKKPDTRPEHIPSTTKGADGSTVNITYNQNGGGYGHMNALGAFIMYDMMSDAIMMNSMMSHQGYHVGGPPVAAYAPMHAPVVYSRGPSLFSVFIFIACLAVVFVVVCATFKT